MEPEKIVEELKDWKHDYRYTTTLKGVSIEKLINQYFEKDCLPSFAFPTPEDREKRIGSCYELSVLIHLLLSDSGYHSDVIHFGWNPNNIYPGKMNLLNFVTCMHCVTRFWHKEEKEWRVIHGCMNKQPVSLLGPFSSEKSFMKEISQSICKETNRDKIEITFLDIFSFENKPFPTLIQRLIPDEERVKTLGYWRSNILK